MFWTKKSLGKLVRKYLSQVKLKGHKNLLVGDVSTVGIDKIPMQNESEETLEGDTDLDKQIVKLDVLDILTHEKFILSIHINASVGNVAFGLVHNAKSLEVPKGNNKVE